MEEKVSVEVMMLRMYGVTVAIAVPVEDQFAASAYVCSRCCGFGNWAHSGVNCRSSWRSVSSVVCGRSRVSACLGESVRGRFSV